MTPLEMIAEWRRGCSCAPRPDHPEDCPGCTRGLIDALEAALLRARRFTAEEIALAFDVPVADIVEYEKRKAEREDDDQDAGEWALRPPRR